MEIFYILKSSYILTCLNVMTYIKKISHSTFLSVNITKKIFKFYIGYFLLNSLEQQVSKLICSAILGGQNPEEYTFPSLHQHRLNCGKSKAQNLLCPTNPSFLYTYWRCCEKAYIEKNFWIHESEATPEIRKYSFKVELVKRTPSKAFHFTHTGAL